MKYIRSALRAATVPATFGLVTALAGCGAGIGDAGPATADTGAYADIVDYCGGVEPTNVDARRDGWSVNSRSTASAPFYDVIAIVSVGGASSAVVPVNLGVELHDYRTLSAIYRAPGYAESQAKMGVAFSAVLSARSAACVANLAKLTPVPRLPGDDPVTRYTVAWRSKWAANVPLTGVSGQVIDGFEFVANVELPDATVFFRLPKVRIATGQGMNICYRAPLGASWECAPATVADETGYWSASRHGARAGVYVITTPSHA